jgi:hypothetical protein
MAIATTRSLSRPAAVGSTLHTRGSQHRRRASTARSAVFRRSAPSEQCMICRTEPTGSRTWHRGHRGRLRLFGAACRVTDGDYGAEGRSIRRFGAGPPGSSTSRVMRSRERTCSWRDSLITRNERSETPTRARQPSSSCRSRSRESSRGDECSGTAVIPPYRLRRPGRRSTNRNHGVTRGPRDARPRREEAKPPVGACASLNSVS